MGAEELNNYALEKVADVAIDNTVTKAMGLLDLFLPQVQNKLMEKRIDSAVKTAETINARLAQYGIKVDYLTYFSEKLQVPLEWARAVSEVDIDDKRELLQNLFIRHLTGKYDDDGFYPSFIRIIEEMTSEDINILMSINEGKNEDYPATNIRHLFRMGLIDIYHEITVPKTDEDALSVIDGGDINSEPANVTWGLLLGEQKAVQVGAPYITAYGHLFIEACTSPLDNSYSSK